MLRDDGEALPDSSQKGDWEGEGKRLTRPNDRADRISGFFRKIRDCQGLGWRGA